MTHSIRSPSALPLVICVTALAVAALILVSVVTGLAHNGSATAPAWSGDQAPPGAVGLSPERSALRSVPGSGSGTAATPAP